MPPRQRIRQRPQSVYPVHVFGKTKMCKFHILGECSKGESCLYAHSAHQMSNKPDLSRTKLCKALINTGHCDDAECNYAHNREELRVVQPEPLMQCSAALAPAAEATAPSRAAQAAVQASAALDAAQAAAASLVPPVAPASAHTPDAAAQAQMQWNIHMALQAFYVQHGRDTFLNLAKDVTKLQQSAAAGAGPQPQAEPTSAFLLSPMQVPQAEPERPGPPTLWLVESRVSTAADTGRKGSKGEAKKLKNVKRSRARVQSDASVHMLENVGVHSGQAPIAMGMALRKNDTFTDTPVDEGTYGLAPGEAAELRALEAGGPAAVPAEVSQEGFMAALGADPSLMVKNTFLEFKAPGSSGMRSVRTAEGKVCALAGFESGDDWD